MVAGVPDSGTGHAIGYANQARVPYGRPFVKYTPTWPRSFMPQDQRVRDLVARMKLIPIPELFTVAGTTNGSGDWDLGAPLNGGNGPATFYVQVVYIDPTQTFNLGFSNAVQVDLLP